MTIRSRTTIAVACAAGALLGAGAHAGTAGDGGSGTYTSSGTNHYMVLFNARTTRWMFFHLVGPPGTVFVSTGTAPLTRVDDVTYAGSCATLKPRYHGRSVRIVATATVDGASVTTASRPVAVR